LPEEVPCLKSNEKGDPEVAEKRKRTRTVSRPQSGSIQDESKGRKGTIAVLIEKKEDSEETTGVGGKIRPSGRGL